MIHTLLHPLRILWNDRITLFWPIWAALTGLGILLVALFVPGRSLDTATRQNDPPIRRSRFDKWALVALAALLILYVAGSLVWEDFTYYDNSHFTNETLIGHDVALQVSAVAGRFWPLGYQEFSIVRHITTSPFGYHVIRIAELLLVCGVIVVLDKELRIRERVSLLLLLLITPSIVIIFSGLIYSEANVIASFVCLIWCVARFQETGRKEWAIGAVLFAQIMLYYKETAFVLVGGFAIGHLLCSCRRRDAGGWDFARLKDPETRLDICLIILVGIFLLYYRAAMYPIFGMGYGNDSKLPFAQVVVSDFRIDLLAWVFVGVAIVRAYLILRSRALVSPLWDGLAVAGITMFAAYLYLQMTSGYYLAPIDLIAVLYLGRIAILTKSRVPTTARWLTAAIASLVILQDLSLSAFRVYEAKNTIHAKSQEGLAIASLYRSHPEQVRELFFPYASAFDILEFGSYLSYHGVPIEQQEPGGLRSSGVELVGRSILKDGPCGYRTFMCHPAPTPREGDLVVIFPDDPKRSGDSFAQIAKQDIPIMTYDPHPGIPDWMLAYVAPLHVISPEFAFTGLPPDWLGASVTLRR
jgi:hypothetical protein